MQYYVYIVASSRNGTLYIGVTSDLAKRIAQHKKGLLPGFTKRYQVSKLVYYEIFSEAREALLREKHLKKWNRKWKLRIIEERNPNWIDLYESIR